MSDALALGLAWIAGVALGVFFFGGLWWTVRRAMSARQPARVIFGSLLVRVGVALAGLYLVSGRRLDRLLLCLLGFVIARALVTRATRGPRAARRLPSWGHRGP